MFISTRFIVDLVFGKEQNKKKKKLYIVQKVCDQTRSSCHVSCGRHLKVSPTAADIDKNTGPSMLYIVTYVYTGINISFAKKNLSLYHWIDFSLVALSIPRIYSFFYHYILSDMILSPHPFVFGVYMVPGLYSQGFFR